jgi:hypothetical protein
MVLRSAAVLQHEQGVEAVVHQVEQGMRQSAALVLQYAIPDFDSRAACLLRKQFQGTKII